MDKRERLEKTLAGQQPDRRAVSLWRHWPGDDQRAADLAKSTIWFQQQFDWDFSVVAPANNFSVVDYGLQDAWQGSSYGLRDITKRVVQRSLDWTHLRTLDPMRGDLAKQVDCLRLVGEAFEADRVPFIQPVYSPFAQALRLAGRERLVSHLRQEPARLQTGLNILTRIDIAFRRSVATHPGSGNSVHRRRCITQCVIRARVCHIWPALRSQDIGGCLARLVVQPRTRQRLCTDAQVGDPIPRPGDQLGKWRNNLYTRRCTKFL